MAAFKSNTKRHYSDNGNPVKASYSHSEYSPPKEKNPAMESGNSKAEHRRSRSVSEFSGDGSPTHNALRAKSRLKSQPIRSTRLLTRQLSEAGLGWNIKEGTNETDCCLRSPSTQYGSPKLQDLESRVSIKLFKAESRAHMDIPDSPAEEKIIRAVHAQQKPLPSDLLSMDGHAIPSNLWSIIQAEVQSAVSDMKNSLLEQSWPMEESSPLEWGKKDNLSNGGVIKALREACKDYEVKLDESEKKMETLKAKLEAERKRCSDMEKLFKGFVPTAASSILKAEKQSATPKNGTKNSAVDAFLVKALCERDLPLESNSGLAVDRQEQGKCADKMVKVQEIITGPDCPLSGDGVFLPWLQVGAEIECSVQAIPILQHGAFPIGQQGNQSEQQSCAIERVDCKSNALAMPENVPLGRAQFQNRVKSGELLLCIGLASGSSSDLL